MEKEEYLYMIVNNIDNAKKLREDSINQKEFYQKINGDKNIIRNLDNNIELYNKTIESLENLKYLPVYEIINKMSSNELLNYKKNILSEIDNSIFKERNQIEKLNSDINELNKNIEEISANYLRYKKEKVLNDEQLNCYITECKEIQQEQVDINNEIKEHENKITEMMTRKNIIESKTTEEIREYLINTYDLNNIKYELDRYKVTRSDEIIVNLCNNLTILDEIDELIREYIKLNNNTSKKTMRMPEIFRDYKIHGVSSINDYILTKCFETDYSSKTNEITFNNIKDIDVIKNNIEMVVKEINSRKNSLIDFKLEVNELSKLSFYTINKDLINFVTELCNTLYLTELEKNNVSDLYNKYIKLVNKKYRTEYSVNKSITIEKELKYEIKNILDVYWGVLCERLESTLIGIKSDFEFISNISSYDIHKGKDKMLFDTEEFSEIGLLNMRVLIEKVLTKYTEINNVLNTFNDDLSNCKNNIIDNKNNKEKELNNIKNKIDNLYFKVSPKDFPILVEDYENLNKIFNERALINSIVKMNRKNLISQVRSESVKYRDNNVLIEDIEVIKKKVLNKE